MLTGIEPLRRARLGDRLQVTVRARRALTELLRTAGPHHLVLTWPAGVALLPAGLHRPSGHEAIVGHLARCPIYVDLRQVATWPTRQAVLDVTSPRVRPGRRPCFVLHDVDRRPGYLARPA